LSKDVKTWNIIKKVLRGVSRWENLEKLPPFHQNFLKI
jgi:hypothetical protein